MKKYSHKEIEQKIQEEWKKAEVFKTDFENNNKEKFYLLDMFPYPSGDGLHMGHTEQTTITDTLYRFKRMKGQNVLHPQGFDSFGLPAENYAVKTGIPPAETIEKTTQRFREQMDNLGLAYDFFDNSVITSKPEYYKWTQWLFGKFFKNDLVYKKSAKANFCPTCQTVIANEQVENGKCERCKTEVEQKDIPSWMFRITDFADDLIWTDEQKNINWPEYTKKNQNVWIGKSEGAKIKFPVKFNGNYLDKEIEVFTTRPDTLFGATYMVLAPEHPLVQEFLQEDLIKNPDEIREYIKETKKKSERDRLENKEKTGVELKGVLATNPARERSGMNDMVDIPIFIADYVLSSYGTGAIMAVPAHDERDFEFAKKFGIEIKEVITGKKKENEEIFSGLGILKNSGEFDGMTSEEAKKKITEFVGGELTSTYRLRDWSISRQRYWGTPIPIVYDPEGKAHYVGDKNLPWTLPTDVDFVPTGKAPLAKSKELKERVERIFGEGWTPEVDTMDTFVDSSWYFFRYPDPQNDQEFANQERLKKWMPVDLYIGGAEHTYMHLLYARFFAHAMYKMNLVNFKEPFLKLRHQGMILDKNGVKMSKSKGNVVNPDEMVERFGADATRAYMLFAGPIEDDKMWNEDNIVGIYRFIEKVWRQQEKLSDDENLIFKKELHRTIKKVSTDTEDLKFNTAISEMMKLMNFADKQEKINKADYLEFIKILSPFTPHVAEEIWKEQGGDGFLIEKNWPQFDEDLAKVEKIKLGVQVNGKRRGEIEISPEADENEVVELSKENLEIARWLEGEIVKVIYVPGRILNLIVK